MAHSGVDHTLWDALVDAVRLKEVPERMQGVTQSISPCGQLDAFSNSQKPLIQLLGVNPVVAGGIPVAGLRCEVPGARSCRSLFQQLPEFRVNGDFPGLSGFGPLGIFPGNHMNPVLFQIDVFFPEGPQFTTPHPGIRERRIEN